MSEPESPRDAFDRVLRRDLRAATEKALELAVSSLGQLGGFALCATDSGGQVFALANEPGHSGSEEEFAFGDWSEEIHAPFEELHQLEAHAERWPELAMDRFATLLSVLQAMKTDGSFAEVSCAESSFVLAVAGVDPSPDLEEFEHQSVRSLSHPQVGRRLQDLVDQWHQEQERRDL